MNGPRLSTVVLLAVGVAGGSSCAQRARTGNARRPAPAIYAGTGVSTTMQRQVKNAVDAGDGDYALRSLRERLAREPENVSTRLEIAQYYERRGAPDLALEHYRLAAARFPESGEVRLRLARALRAAGLLAEAVNTLDEFLKQHPQSSPEYASWLGILRDETGRIKQGEEAHRAAVALAPGRDSLHNNLGYNLLEQQRFEEAVAEFRRALELNPQSRIARNNLDLALAARPGSEAGGGIAGAAARNNLGALLIEQGRYDEARKQLELALAVDRSFAPALNNLKLISDLDHKPVTVPQQGSPAPGWKRFFGTVWRGLWGIENPRQAGSPAGRTAVPAASGQ